MTGALPAIEEVKIQLGILFFTEELGACTHYLSIRIDCRTHEMFLLQQPFATKIVKMNG